MKGWLQDIGCVAWDHRMEDLATFEISRAQTWQWLHHGVELDDGTEVTKALIRQIFDEEVEKITDEVRDYFSDQPEEVVAKEIERFERARAEAERIFTEERFRPFLACKSNLVGDDEQHRALLRGNSCGT
jgi:malate synthase